LYCAAVGGKLHYICNTPHDGENVMDDQHFTAFQVFKLFFSAVGLTASLSTFAMDIKHMETTYILVVFIAWGLIPIWISMFLRTVAGRHAKPHRDVNWNDPIHFFGL
jgi:hypothetical protein